MAAGVNGVTSLAQCLVVEVLAFVVENAIIQNQLTTAHRVSVHLLKTANAIDSSVVVLIQVPTQRGYH